MAGHKDLSEKSSWKVWIVLAIAFGAALFGIFEDKIFIATILVMLIASPLFIRHELWKKFKTKFTEWNSVRTFENSEYKDIVAGQAKKMYPHPRKPPAQKPVQEGGEDGQKD